jgi:hypothetical protein
MVTQTESRHTAEFLVSEEPGYRSRESVTVTATGAALQAGTVLGKITATGKYVKHDTAAADGSQNAAAILFEDIDAVETAKTVIVRDAVVLESSLTWGTGSVAPHTATKAALTALGVIVR